MELTVDDAAVVGIAQSFSVGLLGVDDKGSCPEMNIMENRSGFDEAAPVHVFQDPDAVHDYDSSQAEADKGDSFAITEVRFEKEDGEHAPAHPGLVVRKDELFLGSRIDVHRVKQCSSFGLILTLEHSIGEEV